MDTAVRQLAQSQGPGTNEPSFGQGGQYAFAPITEATAQQHIQQNPAAEQRHVAAPQNAQAANQAQNIYQQAQQRYAQAVQQQGVPQQVAGLQQAAVGMNQFAELAGVQDPWTAPPEQSQQPQGIILPPGVSQNGNDNDNVPVLW